MNEHFIKKCTWCNSTISQCRCPSTNKKVIFGTCEKCENKSITKMDIDIKVNDGKYHILAEEGMKNFRCLRHGEEWRNLCGDGMILALCHRIQDLEYILKILKENRL